MKLLNTDGENELVTGPFCQSNDPNLYAERAIESVLNAEVPSFFGRRTFDRVCLLPRFQSEMPSCAWQVATAYIFPTLCVLAENGDRDR